MQAVANVVENIKIIRGDSSFLELLFQTTPAAAPAEIEVISKELERTDDCSVVRLGICWREVSGLGRVQ